MEILDQSEVDVLLNSGSRGGGDEIDFGHSRRGGHAPREAPRQGPTDLPPALRLAASDRVLHRIEPVQVVVSVRLAQREMSIDQILNLTVGAIIEFEKPADAELDLVVHNLPIGTGNAVKCGENFGLRVIKVEPWLRRVMAMGLYR